MHTCNALLPGELDEGRSQLHPLTLSQPKTQMWGSKRSRSRWAELHLQPCIPRVLPSSPRHPASPCRWGWLFTWKDAFTREEKKPNDLNPGYCFLPPDIYELCISHLWCRVP